MSLDYFRYGISGVSNANIDLLQQDFPKQKNSFITPGKKVTSHIWNLFDSGKSQNDTTLKFIIHSNKAQILTPIENTEMADKSITLLEKYIADYPLESKQNKALQAALIVFAKAKEDMEYLLLCRNALLAG